MHVARWPVLAVGAGVGAGAVMHATGATDEGGPLEIVGTLLADARLVGEKALTVIGAVGNGAANQAADLAIHHVAGPPKGPFPDMAALNARFPAARLPAHLAGTSIDHGALTTYGAERLMAKAAALGMNTVRYGPYWNDVERDGPGSGDLQAVDELLDAAERHGIRVILTVGEKVPSWPEHHIPAWLRDGEPEGRVPGGLDLSRNERFRRETMRWVERVVRHVGDHPAVAMWQVENEPYDQSGPELSYLSKEMVREEVELVRRLDGGRLPVLVTSWSQSDRGPGLEEAFRVADAVGIDVYQQFPYDRWNLDRFGRTTGLPSRALELAKQTGKPAIIAELQAEDWSEAKTTATMVRDNTDHLERLGFRDILWWRMNGWMEQEAAGDRTVVDEVRRQVAETYATWGGAPPSAQSSD